jgi:outer membrane protein assembly factor BamB
VTTRRLPLLFALLAAGLACNAPAGGGDPTPARPEAVPGDWPWWRGPTLDGVAAGAAPTAWGPTENIAWRTVVPGRGHSSPAVRGDRVFLTTADEEARTQSLLAFDRATGARLWQTVAHTGPLPRKNPKNSHASATPACDADRVYVAFVTADGLRVTAVDHAGKVAWQAAVGPYSSEHGYGASPVLYRRLVIVLSDSLKDNYVAALDRDTGKVVWRTARRATGRHGSYGTPVVATLAGRPQLIVSGTGSTTAYDPDTGAEVWTCRGPSEVTGCTPAFTGSLVFASGGFPEKELLAIRPDGRGDVSASHVAWRAARGVTYVPSPLYHDGLLYVVDDTGIATCFDAATGKPVWRERLEGAFTSSPVLAGGRVYVTSEAGRTFVLKAGRDYELVAANDLGEPTLATPAVAGGQLFLRTAKALYCIGRPRAADGPRK